MATASTLDHLTTFDDNDRLDELKDRTPDDRLDFRLLYDPGVVNPWSKGPNELTRLYFNDDELDDYYVPITFPERLEEDVRSTPIGRPIHDDDDGDDADTFEAAGGGEYEIEEDVDIDGHQFDVLRYQSSDEADERIIIAAEIDETND